MLALNHFHPLYSFTTILATDGYLYHWYCCYRPWLCPLLLALPSATGSTLCYWLYTLTIGTTLCYWLYTLCYTGPTLYYWLYPLLLALPSTTGSTLYYWLYPLLLALPSTILALPSAIGSTLCYWLCPLLLALPSTIGSTRRLLV